MASHGGYSAVLSLRQQVLQDYLTIAYGTGLLSSAIFNIEGPVTVLLFLSVPEVECRSSDGDRVRLRFRAVGQVSVHGGNGEIETRSVVAESTVLVAPALGWHSIESTAEGQRFGLHFPGGVTESFAFTPFLEGPFSPGATLVLEEFIPDATAALVVGLLRTLDLSSVIDPSVLGGLANAPSAVGTTIISNGEIAFAVDVAEDTAGGRRMVTNGDPAAVPSLEPLTDISLAVNPIAVPLVFSAIETALRTAAEDEEASLGLYDIETTDGAFVVRGRLSKSSGRVDFSFRAVPQLIRPGMVTRYEDDNGQRVVERQPDAEVLWFKADAVEADASLSWWAAFAAVVLPPVGVPIAFALLNGREEDLREAIRSGHNGVPRVRRFMLGNGASPVVTTRLEQFSCRDDGVLAATRFSHSSFRPGYLDGPTTIGVEEAAAAPPTYRLRLPFAVFGSPQTKAHWEVRDASTSEVVARVSNTVVPDFETFPIQFTLPADLPYLSEPTMLVSVCVVRELGAVTEPLFSATMTVKVRDFLDRSHPYFRWRHEVRVPSVRVEADGARTVQGYPLRRRVSKIHRTAIPGRCRMVQRMSLNRVTAPEPVPPVVGIEYLDTLPFAREELDGHRSEVCEYCFYGGPGHPSPLID